MEQETNPITTPPPTNHPSIHIHPYNTLRTFSSIQILRHHGLIFANGENGRLQEGQQFVNGHVLIDNATVGSRTVGHLLSQVLPKGYFLFDRLHRQFGNLLLEGLVGRLKQGTLQERLQARPHPNVGRLQSLDGLLERGRNRAVSRRLIIIPDENAERIGIHRVDARRLNGLPSLFDAFGRPVRGRTQDGLPFAKMPIRSSQIIIVANGRGQGKIPQFDVAGPVDVKARGCHETVREVGGRVQKVQTVNHGLQPPRQLFVAERLGLQPSLQRDTGFRDDNQVAHGRLGVDTADGGRIVGVGVVRVQRGVDFQNVRMTDTFALLKMVEGWLQLHHAAVATRFIGRRFQEGGFLADKDRHGCRVGFLGAVVNVPAKVVRADLGANGVRQGRRGISHYSIAGGVAFCFRGCCCVCYCHSLSCAMPKQKAIIIIIIF